MCRIWASSSSRAARSGGGCWSLTGSRAAHSGRRRPVEVPNSEFDIPLDHAIMHTLYDVKEIEQVSSIQFWTRNGGAVSERGSDSPSPNHRGIADKKGRLMVVMTHNTDIPDTWEREGESQEYFERFSPNGYAIGVNVVLYAYTH